jgi:Heat induced stress protein YflT domain
MSEQSVVGVYQTMDDAEKAVRALDLAKFPVNQVTIVTRDISSEKTVHGYVTACDVSRQGARQGAWLGGIFGLLVGSAFMWIPGVGPVIVAGSLASALLGGVEGAVAGSALGGILSGLAAWGISKQHILKYEEVVKGGKFLVIAHGSAEDVNKAREILSATGASELTSHPQAA